MGNEAIALGAMASGVAVVTGYPGTPSTEILETVAKRNPGGIYVEWSVNEKAALEVAAGAAMCGARAMVTMKQVGLNVASDPLMSLNYLGVQGGLVLVVADDPGPISSQTEQDTRRFGAYSRVPVLDPESPEAAYDMVRYAFEISEKYHTPVILRPTTRVCHSCASIEPAPIPEPVRGEGFKKSERWVIFPRLSYMSKLGFDPRDEAMAEEFSNYSGNALIPGGRLGVAAGGVSRAYAMESGLEFAYFGVATPYPFPERAAVEFLRSVDQVLVAEELDPVIEDALIATAYKYKLNVRILGKHTGDMPVAGELSCEILRAALLKFAGLEDETRAPIPAPALPARPPVLCAGCPHRASFYAVKRAMRGKKAVFSGDIGCYTLGNAQPLGMVDTCLCMGADVTMAQGINRMERDCLNFAFIGDSTFFHSGITGVINAVYNKSDIILIVLDNSTTAMTGHQTHPGLGKTVMGDIAPAISIRRVLEALDVPVAEVNPLNLRAAIDAVSEAASQKGVRAVIFKSPCVAVVKGAKPIEFDKTKCVGCKMCVRELGCPAISFADGRADIDNSLCTGCALCAKICPAGCMKGAEEDV